MIESGRFDAAVVGGGPAGLAAALALARAGARTALIARRIPYSDNRTTALLGGSVAMLEALGVWRHCADRAAPLRVMRLVDATGRLIRAPEVHFHSTEIGLDTFGYNIENRLLLEALEARAAECNNIARYDADAAGLSLASDEATVTLGDGGAISARLVIGADGRQSKCREAAGIAVSRRPLNQTAVTFNVGHARPHNGVSTEFHTAHGPCVFVPLPGNRSSIVWVVAPAEAERLLALSDADLSAAIEKQSRSILGRLTVEPGRFAFPLAIEKPARLAARRVALIGEAAHVVPPIGAQGLNLGLRDAAAIAEVASDALAAQQDPGSDAVLARYQRLRGPDIAERTFIIDMANRVLLNELWPVQALRAAGMQLIDAVGPLRRLVMREGITPMYLLPRLMHGAR
ncbi:MAG: UbiH/UbiF family hydroxylase [Xanthobacteraceae bacterium]|nr:MAG: UbiH/UbiF family hydroxylase [Xanthobacteraceae bacterium]